MTRDQVHIVIPVGNKVHTLKIEYIGTEIPPTKSDRGSGFSRDAFFQVIGRIIGTEIPSTKNK